MLTLSAAFMLDEVLEVQSNTALLAVTLCHTDRAGTFHQYPLKARLYSPVAQSIASLPPDEILFIYGDLKQGILNCSTCFPISGSESIVPMAHIVGYQAQNPEVKHFNSGSAIVKTRLAVGYGDQTDFYDIKSWVYEKGAGATLLDYGAKGRPIDIVGTPVVESWQDRITGKPRKELVVFAHSLNLIGKKNVSESQAA